MDQVIVSLLFRGFLCEETAALSLNLLETFALAYSEILSAENKLTTTLLLVSAALVEGGESGRARSVMKFLEHLGCAVGSLATVFALEENRHYSSHAPEANASQASEDLSSILLIPQLSNPYVLSSNPAVASTPLQYHRSGSMNSTPHTGTPKHSRKLALAEGYAFMDACFQAFSLIFPG